jgi:hypothetical protein
MIKFKLHNMMEGAANLTWWEFLNFHHATHKTAHEEFNLESIETAICTSCISIMPDTQIKYDEFNLWSIVGWSSLY